MTDPKLTPREPSEAERLAQALTDWKSREVRDLDRLDAAAELRRLAALSESNAIDALNYESRIERLQAENDALRAMHDAAPTVEAEPVARMLVWCGPPGYPTLPAAARTYAEFPETEALPYKADAYWRNDVPLYTHPAAPQPLQGGMSNNELLSQWKKKLPCVRPHWLLPTTRCACTCARSAAVIC